MTGKPTFSDLMDEFVTSLTDGRVRGVPDDESHGIVAPFLFVQELEAELATATETIRKLTDASRCPSCAFTVGNYECRNCHGSRKIVDAYNTVCRRYAKYYDDDSRLTRAVETLNAATEELRSICREGK